MLLSRGKGNSPKPGLYQKLNIEKNYATEVVPFKRKQSKGELTQYFISENHELIISTEEAESTNGIYEYRRKQLLNF